jgi:hypothetical protein
MRILTAMGPGLVLAALAGCDRGTMPPQANADQARAALTRALDAWQKGESIEDLARGDPAVYFNDPRCKSDVKLLAYKVDDGHEFYGQTARIAVMLTFKFPDGATKERKASYLIDTSPTVVIVPG